MLKEILLTSSACTRWQESFYISYDTTSYLIVKARLSGDKSVRVVCGDPPFLTYYFSSDEEIDLSGFNLHMVEDEEGELEPEVEFSIYYP